MLNDAKNKFNIFDYEICYINKYVDKNIFKNTIHISIRKNIGSGEVYGIQKFQSFSNSIKKHNLTNDSSIKCENTGEKVCAVIDRTAFSKEMYKRQLDFVNCLDPGYIIVLTDNDDKLGDNTSYRRKK